MKLVAALVIAVAFPLAALAARPVDVTGVYQSNWDVVRLVQHGKHVTGTYVCCGGGTIDGEIVEDRILRYRWHEPRGAGDGIGVWKLEGDRLDGTWGRKTVDDGGPWTLSRVRDTQIAQ